MANGYLVIYHTEELLDLKTKMKIGRLFLEPDHLSIRGEAPMEIPFSSLQAVEMFRLHGLGRMLRIQHSGGLLVVSVVRFCLFGYFAMVNFLATGKLLRLLRAHLPADE